MKWAAHRQGYSRVWRENYSYIGKSICATAARHGQLDALQWLRQNRCEWEDLLFGLLLQKKAISLSSNGREITDAIMGAIGLV